MTEGPALRSCLSDISLTGTAVEDLGLPRAGTLCGRKGQAETRPAPPCCVGLSEFCRSVPASPTR